MKKVVVSLAAVGLPLVMAVGGSAWGQVATTKGVKTTAEVMQSAEALLQKNSPAEAIQVLNDGLATDPKNAELLVARAKLYAMGKKYDEAIADLKAAGELLPEAGEILVMQGQIYDAKGDMDGSLNSLEAAEKKYDKLSPQMKMALLQALATAKWKVKDFDGALQRIDKLIAMIPADPRVYQMRGTINASAGKLDAAITDQSTCIEKWKQLPGREKMNPQEVKMAEVDAVAARALLYVRAKNLSGALYDFSRVLEASPGNPQVEKAISDAVRDLAKDVKWSKPMVLKVSDVAAATGRSDREAAEKLAKAKYGDEQAKAEASLAKKNYVEAEVFASRSVTLWPSQEGYRTRAQARRGREKFAEAAADYRVAGALASVHWGQDSVANAKDTTAAATDVSWGGYMGRVADDKRTNDDYWYEQALKFDDEDKLVEAHLTLLKKQDYHAPIEEMLGRIWDQHEKLVVAYRTEIEAAMKGKNVARAEELAGGMVSITTTSNGNDYVLMARVYQAAGKSKEMVDKLQYATLVPESAGTAAVMLGDYQMGTAEKEQAIFTYNLGAGGNAAADLSGDAKVAATKRDALEKPYSVADLYKKYAEKGNAQIKDRYFYDLVATTTRMLRMAPKTVELFTLRGGANFQIQAWSASAEDYLQAMKLDPKQKLNGLVGDTFYCAKNYPKAIGYFRIALTETDKPATVYLLLAKSELRLKQFDKALQDAELAVKADSTKGESYYIRGSAYYFLKKWDEAVADFQAAAKAAPASGFGNSANLYSIKIKLMKIDDEIEKFEPVQEKGGPGMQDY